MSVTPYDRRLAKSLGVSLDEAPADPHAACMRGWLEERTARERAERHAVEAYKEFETAKLATAREWRRAQQWRMVAWMSWAAAMALLGRALTWW